MCTALCEFAAVVKIRLSYNIHWPGIDLKDIIVSISVQHRG